MEREFNKEIWTVTFRKIKTFNEMLSIPIEEICFDNKNTPGLHVSDVGYIKKCHTLIHNHPYYKILDCVSCNNMVDVNTFNDEYLFYQMITKVKFGNKTYKNKQEYFNMLLNKNYY